MQKKCLVVGLDGVPFSLLKIYLEKGMLPHLRAIINDGHALSPMDASIPEVSSVSWTSFSTGTNPGEHGIFGFTDLEPRSYQLSFPDSRSVRAPTLWEILGHTACGKESSLRRRYGRAEKAPRRSVVLNVPQTNPALPMNGILVSGFVALDLKTAVYPDSAYRYLESLGYVIDADAARAKEDSGAFLKELRASLEKRQTAFHHFFEREEWDLFLAVFTETDRLHHFFFPAACDENHPYHEKFVAVYRNLDEYIGRLYERFREMAGESGCFMILSDHGFAPIKSEVYVNAYLQREGFLRLDPHASLWEGVGEGSVAFALDPCRIYLNREGRYPRGGVAKGEGDKLLEELTEALRELKDGKGNPVVREVFRGEKVYTGPESDRGPDLIGLPHEGFDLKGMLSEKNIFGKRHFTGMHTREDAHCLLPASVSLQGKPHIEQMAGVILDYFEEE